MDFFDYVIKIKKAIKKTPETFKEEFSNIDYIGSFNDFLNNKKTQKFFVFLGFFAVIIFVFYFINMQLTKYDGPTIKNLTFNSSSYGNITYSGDIFNKKIVGNGLLTIMGEKWAIEFNGLFNESDSFTDSKDIQIGDFSEGTITIINLDSGNKYILSGTFDNMDLKNGTVEKIFDDITIKYTGNFIKYKLNGLGEKYVYINGQSKTFKGIFIDNKLESEN